jgi:hypothetical protein
LSTDVRTVAAGLPKVSMTGINVERVDTRVARVIYATDPDCEAVKQKRPDRGRVH